MAGFFGFLSSFGKEKLGQVGDSITQKIVSWDPETASQAEIEEMIKELDKITIEAGKAKTEFEREEAEAVAARKNYDRYIAAAEMLNKQSDEAKAAGDDGKALALTSSMEKLVGDLEKMSPDVDREQKEAEEAKAYYDEIKELAGMTADKVRTARAQLDSAKRDMQRAQIEKERAGARAENAEHMAGLRKDTSSLGVALSAMNKQADAAKASASASDMKAQLLGPKQTKEDENIQAALKLVAAPDTLATGASVADRLAALRKK